MINEPVVDKLVEKLGSPEHPASRYALCVVVAKRARQIIDQEQSQGPARAARQRQGNRARLPGDRLRQADDDKRLTHGKRKRPARLRAPAAERGTLFFAGFVPFYGGNFSHYDGGSDRGHRPQRGGSDL